MNKRKGPEEPEEQPPAKSNVAGGGVGARAEQVDNPIPRLFHDNSITIHITQRSFEELGPSEIKYFPVQNYWAAMFDKFHYYMFKKYYDRCSTYEITSPKVKISNILMLQDKLTSQQGTNSESAIYTQSSYLMEFTPQSPRQWFKLGTTDNCGESQKILKYKPMEHSDCKIISQLIKVGDGVFEDFEKLTINPAKPDLYAGWSGSDVDIRDAGGVGSDLEAEWAYNKDGGKSQNRTVKDVYISPKNPYLGDYSCSYAGDEPIVPLMHHTTYMRNSDSIKLHKYGDTVEFAVNTNMSGLPLLRHPHNNPFGGIDHIRPRPSVNKKAVEYMFCYPSENRPYMSRGDQFENIRPIEKTKTFKPLKHKFICMAPIKEGDGRLIKQRASFTCEQAVTITFKFPETVIEEDAEYMLAQKSGVILRPAITKIWPLAKEDRSPDSPNPIFDEEREKLRKELEERFKAIETPGPSGWLQGLIDTVIGDNTLQSVIDGATEAMRQLGEFRQICDQITGGGSICPIIPAIQQTEVEPMKDSSKWTFLIQELTEGELHGMLMTEDRRVALFGYLFVQFLHHLFNSGDAKEHVGVGFGEHVIPVKDLQDGNALILIAAHFKDAFRATLEDRYQVEQQRCTNEFLIMPTDFGLPKMMLSWNREGSYDSGVYFSIPQIANQHHYKGKNVEVHAADWLRFLAHSGVYVFPKNDVLLPFIKAYNKCIQDQIDYRWPKIQVDKLEPNKETVMADFKNVQTDLFFV